MPTSLETRILRAAAKPVNFPQIEAAVGRQPLFELGITLCRLVREGRLHYKEPASWSNDWPLYCVNPIGRARITRNQGVLVFPATATTKKGDNNGTPD